MELTPEEKRKIYEEEKARLEAQEKLKLEKKQKDDKNTAIGCLTIFAILFIFGLIGNLTGNDSQSNTSTPSTSTTQTESSSTTDTSTDTSTSSTGNSSDSSSSTKVTGDNAILDNGSASVLVGTTEEALDTLTSAATRNNIDGVKALILSGEAYMVDRGTKVLITDRGLIVTQFKVLEGPHAGEEGWVPSEFIK